MIRTRGIALLGTVAFVKAAYGPAAHQAILDRISPEAAAAFHEVREGGWKPVRHLGEYVEAARLLLAPQAPDFFYRMGRFVGAMERRQGGFAPMVVTPQIAMKMAPLVWRALYDAGSMDVSVEGPDTALVRVRDFPAQPAACDTTRGGIEGLASSEDREASVQEVACRRRGAPWCEFRVTWLPPAQSGA